MALVFAVLVCAAASAPSAQTPAAPSGLGAEIDKHAAAVEREMLEWRRHLHQHPELSNREAETAKYIAARLESFGLQPKSGVGRHGVVAVLQGGRPGPVVALRADMDGLPVKEDTGLPFASRATGEYEGRPVGVMHACGHDAHMAMLLATAKVLSAVAPELPGAVKFVFQPAEEGAPRDEQPAGADLMIKEGVMQSPTVDAVFGLHVFANIPAGHISWRSGPLMAAADSYEIIVRGRQTHGASPWGGIDPIVVASQIVLGLQTIISRQVDITAHPAIVTVGQFEAGVRNNIIPDSARLVGTIRTFDDRMQADVHDRVRRTAQRIAEAAGATAEVRIDRGYPVTVNHPALTAAMMPTVRRVTGDRVSEGPMVTTAEDFSYFQREAPGLFLFLGITPPDQVGKAAQNHSPKFFVDESALIIGVRTLAHLTADYLASPLKRPGQSQGARQP
jgi:amidohydrolase